MKTIDIYQSESDKFVTFEWIGKVKYKGESFGVDGLTDNSFYDVVKDDSGNFKIIDDSGEDYLYELSSPRPIEGNSKGGVFYIIEDPNNILIRHISYEKKNGIKTYSAI